MTYPDALRFLDSLVNYEKTAGPRDDFKLDAIRRLLELAGNPQDSLPRTILVAGTKGKGSVCYQLDAALRGCGLSTGMFVSPHVTTVRERIQLNGLPISERRFAAAVAHFVPLVRRQPVSYFELTAALAFHLFARLQPDYAIVEVGLGGRLDATNLSNPDVSVITRIGYDHLKVLGNTLGRIAREKAGIMRRGRPVVISRQEPEALRSLTRCARIAEAELLQSAALVQISPVKVRPFGSSFTAETPLGTARLSLPLLGRHQVENCRTVLAVLATLGRNDARVRIPGIRSGLGRVRIPARCEVVRRRPLVLVDSCHNPESGQALADVIRDHVRSKVVLVYGSLSGKLVGRTVRPLARHVQQAILVRPDSPRAMPLPVLKSIFGRLHIPYVAAGDLRSALSLALDSPFDIRHSTFPVVVAGSFYLAGEALSLLQHERRAQEQKRGAKPRSKAAPRA